MCTRDMFNAQHGDLLVARQPLFAYWGNRLTYFLAAGKATMWCNYDDGTLFMCISHDDRGWELLAPDGKIVNYVGDEIEMLFDAANNT